MLRTGVNDIKQNKTTALTTPQEVPLGVISFELKHFPFEGAEGSKPGTVIRTLRLLPPKMSKKEGLSSSPAAC